MSHIGQRYALPPEIDHFVDEGFLELSMERPNEMTVDFHIPSSRSTLPDDALAAACPTLATARGQRVAHN